jgi:cell division protein FtsI (penicillin-binding protein 3)
VKPQLHIVDRVVDGEGKTIYRPPVPPKERVISERTAAILNEMLKTVVARGTGQNAALVEHVVAGKTGTAQKAVKGGYAPDKFVASFVGYVPADRPRLVILVVVDEPKGAQYGGTIAAPVFKEIAEAALRYMEVEPSLPRREMTLPSQTQLAKLPAPAPAKAPVAGSAVPDLRGLDARTAIAQAVGRGFAVTTAGSGVVTEQQPPPGASAADRKIALLMKPSLEQVR